ncbi:hypothetical protein MHSWG343_06120 [Candidatus Mycoplasma haematohominis]|uniref:Uncharacterized protein n=1 Tax=Candidatus Mycoplasma haematohominis TaxID=1494318 RepID=A0A478FU39_9MOLU|nr:hypothetical protein MHSWG343_06120 [Candidatus Mycoplasma haemohominis]
MAIQKIDLPFILKQLYWLEKFWISILLFSTLTCIPFVTGWFNVNNIFSPSFIIVYAIFWIVAFSVFILDLFKCFTLKSNINFILEVNSQDLNSEEVKLLRKIKRGIISILISVLIGVFVRATIYILFIFAFLTLNPFTILSVIEAGMELFLRVVFIFVINKNVDRTNFSYAAKRELFVKNQI